MSFVSKFLTVAGTAGIVAAVAGCSLPNVPTGAPVTPSGTATASVPATPTAPASGAVPTSALPSASGQLTGTQLASVLLPQSYFPAGFAPGSPSPASSGDGLSSSPARYDLATAACATFVYGLGGTGFGETAMASDSFIGRAQEYDQLVYQFGSAGAASGFVSGIKSLAGRCHSFTATDSGVTGTFSLSATDGAPVGGHPSLELVQTGTIGSSVVLDTLLVASGDDVFAGVAVGLGTSAPTGVATSAIVYTLMKRQAAAALLG